MQSDPVVGPQFCVPHHTVLQIYKNCCDFRVENAAQELVFSVDKPFGSLCCSNTLRDAKHAPLLRVRRRFFDLRQRRDVFRGEKDGSPEGFLFTLRRAGYCQFTSNMHVFLAGNDMKGGTPDYKIEARCHSYSLKITRHGEVVAKVKSSFLVNWLCCGRPKYTIEVNPGVDQALIVMLVEIFDEISEANKTHVGI